VKEYGMDRSQKAESVASLNAVFNEVGLVVVTRNLGLSVAQSTALRSKMRTPARPTRFRRTASPSLP
jgi:large subunit ribosomal protein L10